MSKSSPMVVREDLVEQVAVSGYCRSKAKARAAVNVLLDYIKDVLNRGHTLAIHNFGRFEVIETTERLGRNPKTGEAKVIPAGRRVKFKPSKHLLHEETASS